MPIDISEPFPDWALPLAFLWTERSFRQFADDFFPRTQDAFVEEYRRLASRARTFGVWKDNLLGGIIICEQASPVVASAHILLSSRLWGTPAAELRKAAELMFASQPSLNRIQSFVPKWNRLAVALAVRLGGKIEGTLRGVTLRGGQPADAVLVGMTREDFVNGSRTGSFGRRDQQQLDRDDGEHLLADPDGRSEPDPGNDPRERSDGGERGHADAGNDGGGDKRGRSDQQDVGGGNEPGHPVPRLPRIRTKRADRTGGTGGRAGKEKAVSGTNAATFAGQQNIMNSNNLLAALNYAFQSLGSTGASTGSSSSWGVSAGAGGAVPGFH